MADDKYIDFIKTTSDKLDGVQEDYPYAVIHVHDDGDDNLYIGEDRITDNLNTGNENLSNPTRKIGGLDASTVGELKQKTMSQIILDMVRAERVIPTVSSNPYVRLTYSGERLVKVGDVLPQKSDFTITSNSGTWSDGTPYWGECETVLNINPGEFGGTCEEGIYTITATGTFGPGESPKDNYGTEYDANQGGTKTSSINITAVEPVYINDNENDITTMVEHLVDYNTQTDLYVTILPEDEDLTKKFMVQLPYEFTTFIIYQFNTTSNSYDIKIDMISVGDNLYVRTDNVNDCKGLSKYKITLKK